MPNSRFFLWLASQNRIVTTDRIHKLGFKGPSRCILCKHDNENVDHLLYRCPFSQVCWDWLRQSLGWYSPLPRSFSDLLSGWPTNLCKGIYSKIWNIFPLILVWEILKERNRRIFCGSELNLEDLVHKIEASIVETANAHLSKLRIVEGSFSFWDNQVKMVWPNLINPPHVYLKSSKEAREKFRLTPPPKEWFKLNFDGAARGNPRIVVIRCIINDHTGHWIAKKAKSISPTSNNLADLKALKEGLKFCHFLGISKIVVECDSQIVLNVIRSRSTPNWVLNSKLEEVINVLDGSEESRICHIFREGNQKADLLANKRVDGVYLLLFRNDL